MTTFRYTTRLLTRSRTEYLALLNLPLLKHQSLTVASGTSELNGGVFQNLRRMFLIVLQSLLVIIQSRQDVANHPPPEMSSP